MYRPLILAGSAVAALSFASSSATAGGTIVSPIYGSYDAECGTNIDCTFGTGLPVVSSGGNEYDSPALFFVNNTPYDFVNPSVTLTGYQDFANGLTATIDLPTIKAGTIYSLYWGSLSATGDTVLFDYDYDDVLGQQLNPRPAACVQPYALCSYVGNFNVAFNATENGTAISSLFSPDPTQPYGNAAKTFVGWEGLDPSGLSETVYDDHSGSTPGVLAYIYTGTQGVQGGVPEPATWTSMILGFFGLGAVLRGARRRLGLIKA